MNNVNTGKIVQISGPVIDVQFESGVLPKIREALSLTVDGRRYVMEVAQHVGDNTVRCVMLSGSEGLSRGMQVEAPGKTIEVPVGENTLGRMFNVLGDPIDGGEAVPATEPHKSIYRKAPSFDEQNPAVEILETGIKASIFWSRTRRAAKSVCSAAQASVRPSLSRSSSTTSPWSTAVTPCLPASASAAVRVTTSGVKCVKAVSAIKRRSSSAR